MARSPPPPRKAARHLRGCCNRIIDAETAFAMPRAGRLRAFDRAYLAMRDTITNGDIGAPLLDHRNARRRCTSSDGCSPSPAHDIDIAGPPIEVAEIASPARVNRNSAPSREPLLAVMRMRGGAAIVDAQVSAQTSATATTSWRRSLSRRERDRDPRRGKPRGLWRPDRRRLESAFSIEAYDAGFPRDTRGRRRRRHRTERLGRLCRARCRRRHPGAGDRQGAGGCRAARPPPGLTRRKPRNTRGGSAQARAWPLPESGRLADDQADNSRRPSGRIDNDKRAGDMSERTKLWMPSIP